MRNIFSKTTAEKRTQNGVKTDSKRTNYGYTILLFAFLTLGFGQVWGVDWYVAGSGDKLGSWSPTGKAMTNKSGNTYYLVTSGWSGNNNVEYKVTNGTWDTAYPSSNKSATVSKTYFIIVFDASTNTVSDKQFNTLTVTGDAAILGSDWNTSAVANHMTFSSGDTWTLTKSNVTLSCSETYAFKICYDDGWTTAYPASNKEFTVADDGVYNITFKYDASTDNVSVTTSAVSTTTNYYIFGSGGNSLSWTAGEGIAMTGPQSDYVSNSYYYFQVTGSRTFKIIDKYNNWDHSTNIQDKDQIDNHVMRTDVDLASGSDDNISIPSTGYIVYYPSTHKICATTSLTNLGKPYDITYLDQGGGAFSGTHASGYPTTHSYGTATTLKTASKTGYTFGGWFTNSACTGSSVSSLGATAYEDDITLYAKWTEKTYSLTFSCSNGTIKVNGASVTSGSTASVNHFTTKTLVATPNSGYRFVNWTLSGTNTNKVTIADASAASTTITATATGATVTANFEALPSGQLDIVAGANGQVKKENGSWGSSASYTEINTAQNLNIYAKANSGYHFVEWTKVGDGSITTNAANGVYAMTARGSATVTANFAETKHNVSVQYKCGSTTIKTATTASNVGEVTTSNVSAPEISGYNFSNWTIESGVTATTSTSSTPITIKTKSSGTYTITANYTEDLSTPYVIKGGTAITGSDWTVDIPFTKKSGESTGTIAYAEIPISAAVVGDDANTNYNFKVVKKGVSDVWYGLSGEGDWWYSSSSGERTMVVDNQNIQLRANVVGTYTVKLDYTNSSSPKITITWPVALSIYRSNPTDGTNIGDHAWNSMPTSTSYRWNLDLEANTTYEFKINDKGSYYGHDTEITTSISNRVFSTGAGDTKLKTKSAGSFMFTWDGSGHHLTVIYPKSADMTASPASVYTGGTTTLTGYASELGSGSHTITYEFYKGTELTPANLIASKSKTESATYQQETHDVTVNFDGNTTSQIYTIQIKEGGSILATNTVTVYRKWDIYVHDVASWNAMKLYMYSEDGLTHNEEWPGPDCSNYNGSTTWYTVPLDAKYDRFILNNNAGKKQTFAGEGALRTDITTYIPGTYWYTNFNSTTEGISYYGLTNITLSAPTVTIAATVTNATQLNLTGTVTNCGGDGSFASDMKEVYFNVNNVKDAASITASTTDGTFTKSLNNPTPDNTNNTLQAAATNIYDTGTSSAIRFSRVTLDKQSGSDGTSTILAVNGASMASGATAPTRTGYTFGGYYASAGGSGTQYYNASMGSTNNWDQTTATKTIYAQWTPKTYDVTLNVNGGSGENQTITATYDADMPTTLKGGGAIAARTKVGYNFAGYTQNADGTGTQYYTTALTSNHIWDQDVPTPSIYAKWTPKQSALTFDYQTSAEGHGADGTLSAASSATYDAAMPSLSGSLPTAAAGYCFMGFFDATGGEGKQYYDGTGTSVTTWDKDITTGTTLYAYYKKAEITNLTFDAAVVAPSASVGVTPTVAPTPAGTNSICWKLLYNNGNLYTPQPTFSPENPGGVGNKVTFNAPSTSGMYLVAAVLRTGSSCDGGTKLDSVTYPFQVAGDHTVTVQYKCGNTTIAASTTTIGRPLVWSSAIAAPEIFGYTFHHWLAGDGVTLSEDGINAKTGERADSSVFSSIYIKAIYDGKLTAVYTQENIIYFKDNLGWTDPADPDAHVYVNLLTTDKWTDNKGTGNSGVTNRNLTMNRVEGTTDIFYYNYGNKSVTYVSFTKERMDDYDYFYQESPNVAHVVFPTRYADALTTNKVSEAGFKAMTPMFVPLEGQTGIKQNDDRADYYNRGYWTMYTPGTGYTLEIYNEYGNSLLKSIAFTSEDDLMPMKAVADLEAGHNYKYQIRRGGTGSDGIYYGNSGTMTYKNHGQSTAWDMSNPPSFSMVGIEANAAGDYIFHLSYSTYGDVDAYRLRIAVDYPIAGGDYRVIYKDDAHTSKPSAIVTNANNAKDTVSFFIRHNQNPSMKIQQATVDGETGAITWNDVEGGTVDLSSITQTGVYNICLTMDGSGAISVENKEPYTGNFYIRTDCAVSKWDNYKNADHLMTYSLYSEEHSDFSHYFMGHVYGGTNVKFVVANDYSPCISDTLIVSTYRGGDAAHVWDSDGSGHGAGDLKADEANIRFMWNRANNAVYRAYLAPAQSDGSNFLVLRGTTDDNLMDENGNPLRNASNSEQDGYNHKAPDYCIQFVDDENWIYEATVQVEPSSYVKLYALFNSGYFYYKGTKDDIFDDSHAIKLVEGSGDAVKVRVIYDFKTDRLVAAYMPSGEISTKMDINADVMFIREHQGDIAQLTFTDDGSITAIKTAYAVMRFNKWTLNNKEKTGSHNPLASPASIYERSLYYVSFPFRVKLSEVFGFGTYGQHWIIQRYRGDLRAQQGFWAESAGFWEFIWNRNGEVYLEPNEGYILTLETELLGVESDVWGPRSVANQVELYFPSYSDVSSITNASITQTLPAHTCTINRAATEGLPDTSDPSTSYNRTIFDSHWNIMSVPTYVNVNNPSFANTTWIANNSCPKFLYTWNPDDNTLTATSGTGFVYHAMHAYTVQYYGNVTWTTSVTPTAAPQRNTEYRGEYEFCLEVQQDEQMIDRTFVRLSDDEKVTTGFEFGEDMTKQFNSRKANIFTIAGNTSLGGNSLPLSTTQTTVVPVGVSIKSAGDYTFAIPEGTEGIGVTLVDNETGVRTSLSALDYTVTLQPGNITDRFVLEISPIHNTPTGLEEPTSDSTLKGRAQKVMIDGILYIVKDGKIFDARGARVE